MLKPTLQKLNEASIPFAIGGSGCLFVLGNERLPDDVDIFLPNEYHDQADAIFGCKSYYYTSAQENVRNSNPEGSHSMQLTSDLVLTIAGKTYDLHVTDDILAHRLEAIFEETPIFFYPPEDVLLTKALMQRGPDVGKHDIEDVRAFMQIYSDLRMGYALQRIQALGAEERVRTLLS